MAGLKVTIKRRVRIKAPALTRADRVAIGNVAIDVIRKRIQSGLDGDDSPAKPLTVRSAIQKQRAMHRRPIRDWTFTGALLASLRVTVATEKRILISPTPDQKQKLAWNQALCEMFALSPRDEEEINTIFELRAIQKAREMTNMPGMGTL